MPTSPKKKNKRGRGRPAKAEGRFAQVTLLQRTVLVGAIGIAVVAATIGVWWFGFRSNAELATSAPAIPATIAAGGATDASLPNGVEAFTIVTDQSEASYFAKEQLASLSVPSTAQGTTHSVTGTFFLDSDGLFPDRTSQFVVDLRELRSDKSRRDENVQRVLDTRTFPEATFTAQEIDGYPLVFPSGGEEIEMVLRGDLEIRGVTQDVAWSLLVRRDGSVLTALGTVTFDLADFGVPVPNVGGFVSVESEMTLQVQMVASSS